MFEKKTLAVAGILIIVVGLAWFYMMPDYGKTGRVGYELAQALYSACSMKDPARIDKVKTMLEEQLEVKQINRKEYRWLSSIIRLAENKDWKAAVRESRKLLDTQVSYSQSAPSNL